MILKVSLLFLYVLLSQFLQCDDEIVYVRSPFKQNEQPLVFQLTEIIYPEFSHIISDSTLNKNLIFKLPLEKELAKYELGEIILFDYSEKNDDYVENSLNYINNDKLYKFRINQKDNSIIVHQMYNCNYGESYIILWVKEQNNFIFSNAFWGKLIKNNSSTYELILNGSLGGEESIQTLKKLDLQKNYITERLQYSSSLSIPHESQILNEAKLIITQNNCVLRVWPEIINNGLFDDASQSKCNGNISEVFKENASGFVYAQYISNDKIKWLFVKLISPQTSAVNYFNIYGKFDYYSGWVKEDEIKYK